MINKKWIIFVCYILVYGQIYAQKSHVITDSFFTTFVNLELKYTTILPSDYYKSNKRYPTVFLLHGHTGNYTSWITYAKLPIELATLYNCIIILPDAGNSWYVNWTGQTDGKPHQWEDMLVKDLIHHVDKTYRTITSKRSRAIGGLSMGGFGALAVGLKNHHLFGFVFSSAGAINFCRDIKSEMAKDTLDWNSPELWSDDKKIVDSKGFSNGNERTPKGLIFKTAADADLYDPFLLLEKIDSSLLPYIHIDCGNEDYHLKVALTFTNSIKNKTNKYSLLVMPGNHEVPYWEQAIRHSFSIINKNIFYE